MNKTIFITDEQLEQYQGITKNCIFSHDAEILTYDENLFIDMNLWSMSNRLMQDVNSIAVEIHPPALRDMDKVKKHLLVGLVNLFVAHLTSSITWIAYSRNKNDYSSRSRYNTQRMSHLYMTKVVDQLSEHGYIHHAKGFFDRSTPLHRGKLSRMRPTEKLRAVLRGWSENMICLSPHVETILLRDKDKQPVEYERDTRDVERMRRNLNRLNEGIAKADVRLDITEDELADLNDLRQRHGDTPMRYWKKAMHRIFSNRSFRQGGRFYRCWWMGISEEMRQRILIDGEEAVEKDYNAIHPTILYARKTGELPPHDPYEIDGPATSDIIRKVAKKLLLVMVNAKRGEAVKKAWVWHRDRYDNFTKEERDKIMALDIDEVIAKIKKHNKSIASYFSSNEGIRLQYEDSMIAERVMMTLSKQGILSLPVHDSFVVQKRHGTALQQAMKDAFMQRFGVEPKIK